MLRTNMAPISYGADAGLSSVAAADGIRQTDEVFLCEDSQPGFDSNRNLKHKIWFEMGLFGSQTGRGIGRQLIYNRLQIH